MPNTDQTAFVGEYIGVDDNPLGCRNENHAVAVQFTLNSDAGRTLISFHHNAWQLEIDFREIADPMAETAKPLSNRRPRRKSKMTFVRHLSQGLRYLTCSMLLAVGAAVAIKYGFKFAAHFIMAEFDGAEAFRLISGDEARDFISTKLVGAHSIPSITETCPSSSCHVFEGGSFNGAILYWTCRFDSRESAIATARAWAGHNDDQFVPFNHSEFACVMLGPGFYDAKRKCDWWNVTLIRNGLVSETIADDGRKLFFIAIDLDTLTVSACYESGGFPQEKYQADAQREP